MAKVTFTNQGAKEWSASTGELIGFYNGTELWGRGSSGWYITEVDGEFRGIKFDTLREAKGFLAQRYDVVQGAEFRLQAMKSLLNKTEKTLEKYYASINKGA